MSQGDRAAVHVNLVPIPALVGKSVAICQDLGGEGFIKFDQVHILRRPTSLLVSLAHGPELAL